MRQLIYSVMFVLILSGCTNINENILIDVQDFASLTTENIETNLKVANLTLDPVEFENMYTNFNDDIEIEGFLTINRNGETLIENEVVEVEIKGKASSSFDLKSLGVKFDDTYNNEDKKLINPELLPFHSVERVKAFRFRNSGNDFLETMIKDMTYTKLAINAGLDIDLTYAEQTVVFVNNEFLGVMNLRTEGNTNGISRLYDVPKDDVTLAKMENNGVLEYKDGDFEKLDRLIAAINNQDYDYLKDEIDVSNFIDYMAFQSYVGNRDWPKNNVRFFAILDGPFRFVMFDLDLVSTQNIDESPISFINNPVKNAITDLFNVMYANPEFKQQFDERFSNLINSGMLSAAKFDDIATAYQRNIEHIMPTQVSKYNTPETFTDWHLNIENLKSVFKDREDFVRN